jgi:hypothetical protein
VFLFWVAQESLCRLWQTWTQQQDKETTASFRHGRTRDAMGRFPTLQRSASILGCLEMTLILRKIQDAQAECMEQTLQGLEEGTLKAERENIIQDCKSNSAEDDFKRHQAQKESLMPSSIDWEVWINCHHVSLVLVKVSS